MTKLTTTEATGAPKSLPPSISSQSLWRVCVCCWFCWELEQTKRNTKLFSFPHEIGTERHHAAGIHTKKGNCIDFGHYFVWLSIPLEAWSIHPTKVAGDETVSTTQQQRRMGCWLRKDDDDDDGDDDFSSLEKEEMCVCECLCYTHWGKAKAHFRGWFMVQDKDE